jgi:hypothetical protein
MCFRLECGLDIGILNSDIWPMIPMCSCLFAGFNLRSQLYVSGIGIGHCRMKVRTEVMYDCDFKVILAKGDSGWVFNFVHSGVGSGLGFPFQGCG